MRSFSGRSTRASDRHGHWALAGPVDLAGGEPKCIGDFSTQAVLGTVISVGGAPQEPKARIGGTVFWVSKTSSVQFVPRIPRKRQRIEEKLRVYLDSPLYDAFISYARGDLAFAESLKKGLDAEHLQAFIDVHSLRAAQEWPPQLGAALRKSRMMVLCWSAQALASEWVSAEINLCLLVRKPVLPWLLDRTPLPARLSRTHGARGSDLTPIVSAVARERQRLNRRRMATWVPAGVLAAVAPLLTWRLSTDRTLPFRGHVVDETGIPLAGVSVEADGVHDQTRADGNFRLFLPGPPGRGLHVMVRKAGFVSREIDTQSDVPDLGVVLERKR